MTDAKLAACRAALLKACRTGQRTLSDTSDWVRLDDAAACMAERADLTTPGDAPFELLRSETDGLCIYDHGNDLIRPLNNLLPVTEAEAVAICAALNHVAALTAAQGGNDA